MKNKSLKLINYLKEKTKCMPRTVWNTK